MDDRWYRAPGCKRAFPCFAFDVLSALIMFRSTQNADHSKRHGMVAQVNTRRDGAGWKERKRERSPFFFGGKEPTLRDVIPWANRCRLLAVLPQSTRSLIKQSSSVEEPRWIFLEESMEDHDNGSSGGDDVDGKS